MAERIEKKEQANSDAQHARFVETARKLGCDESEEAFDEKLKVIARHKPKDEKPEQPAHKPTRNSDE